MVRWFLLSTALLFMAWNPTNLGPVQVDTIVLDAGHGGKDPGTHGKYAKEKDIALKVVLQLYSLFKKYSPKTKVILTRKDDTFVPLHKRAELANKSKADIFVSVHCNANPNSAIWGSETYAMGIGESSEKVNRVAMMENSVILMEENWIENYDGFDPRSEEAYIIFTLLQHAFLKQSLQLAAEIEAYMQVETKRVSRGVKQAPFWVLRATVMPSVLCEIGFLTNSRDEKFLRSPEGQQQIAKAIYKGLYSYAKKKQE